MANGTTTHALPEFWRYEELELNDPEVVEAPPSPADDALATVIDLSRQVDYLDGLCRATVDRYHAALGELDIETLHRLLDMQDAR